MTELEKTSLLRPLQWFPIMSGTISPTLSHALHRGHLEMCGFIFGCYYDQGRELLLVFSIWRIGMLNFLKCYIQSCKIKYYSAQYVKVKANVIFS